MEETDGHFTSTSRSTDGLLVRRDSRGHLTKSLSAKRVSSGSFQAVVPLYMCWVILRCQHWQGNFATSAFTMSRS